jgi:hypothetical protein
MTAAAAGAGIFGRPRVVINQYSRGAKLAYNQGPARIPRRQDWQSESPANLEGFDATFINCGGSFRLFHYGEHGNFTGQF